MCGCRYLVHCLQADLNNYMPAFLDDPEEHNPQRPKIGEIHVDYILSSASRGLRYGRTS